jgi:hypothetical protein
MLSAVVVIEYAHNPFYILFVCLGGALGIHFTIRNARRGQAPAEQQDAAAANVAMSTLERFAVALPRRAAAGGHARAGTSAGDSRERNARDCHATRQPTATSSQFKATRRPSTESEHLGGVPVRSRNTTKGRI